MRDPRQEVLLRNTRGSLCTQCGEAHEFYTINCFPVTFPADLASMLEGEVVLVPEQYQGRYRQAPMKKKGVPLRPSP